MRVGVLALQGDFREHLSLLGGLGINAIPVKHPDDLDSLSGLVLPGGESTAIAKLLEIFNLLEPLRSRIREGLPALGTCAGLILLADRVEGLAMGQQLIGGLPVTVERNAYGSQLDSFEYKLDTPQGLEKVAFIRAPRIRSIDNAEVMVMAELNGEPIAVRYKSIIGASFHPELTGSTWLHRRFLETIGEKVAR